MPTFSKKYIDKVIKDVYDGKISVHDLPEGLYHDIADELKGGLYKGFGVDLRKLEKMIEKEDFAKYREGDVELLAELRDNIYHFSAAKTYQQVREMTDALIDNDGTLRSFQDFKVDAGVIFDNYNVNYLKTEYNTATAQGMAAVKWSHVEDQKDVLPNLSYSTIGDACEICEPLDGLTAPVDDPVWSEIMPPNHFNCACIVEQEDSEADLTSDQEKGEVYDHALDTMSDDFKMNAGKDRYVFSPDHPYFDAPKELAKNNFNLPIPKSDRS